MKGVTLDDKEKLTEFSAMIKLAFFCRMPPDLVRILMEEMDLLPHSVIFSHVLTLFYACTCSSTCEDGRQGMLKHRYYTFQQVSATHHSLFLTDASRFIANVTVLENFWVLLSL